MTAQKNHARLIEAVSSVLGVTVKDLERLVAHPAARVTVSAPGGFHVQSTVSEVMARCATEAAVLSKSVLRQQPSAKPKNAAPVAPVAASE